MAGAAPQTALEVVVVDSSPGTAARGGDPALDACSWRRGVRIPQAPPSRLLRLASQVGGRRFRSGFSGSQGTIKPFPNTILSVAFMTRWAE